MKIFTTLCVWEDKMDFECWMPSLYTFYAFLSWDKGGRWYIMKLDENERMITRNAMIPEWHPSEFHFDVFCSKDFFIEFASFEALNYLWT